MPRPSVTTADQLLTLHDPPWRHELVRGELRTMSPAGYRHGDVISVLHGLLYPLVRASKLGKLYLNDTGFVLARRPDTVLAPDIAFVRRERVPASRGPGFFEGPPDLAIEVRSPGDSRRKLRAKGDEWLAHGTPSVWLVDPEDETVIVLSKDGTVCVLTAADDLKGVDPLPGFVLPVREIFAD